LRNDFRNFRVDRILGSHLLDERFEANSGKLMAQWLALPKDHSRAPRLDPGQLLSRRRDVAASPAPG
jgi:predicted DNA-binding transcriptional regulator YafY